MTEWELRVENGAVVARHDQRPFTFTVDASARADAITLEVRHARWRRIRVPVPRWLRIERRVELPTQPNWTLAHADVDGSHVRFRLHINDLVQRVDVGMLRDAIVQGSRLIV